MPDSSYKMNPWVPTTNLLELRRLGKLIEELGEAAAAAGRCIIQGIDASDPDTGIQNSWNLTNELADVKAQIECCIVDLNLSRERIEERVQKKIGHMIEWEESIKGKADA